MSIETSYKPDKEKQQKENKKKTWYKNKNTNE